MGSFQNHTNYSKPEDIKRLKFILWAITTYPHNKKIRILDIGCGNGNISFQCAKEGYLVTGIDKSKQAIQNARNNWQHENLVFKHCKIQNINDKDSFDIIICSEVLEHLYEPDTFLQNIKQLLKSEGLFIVTVPNGYGPREVFITKPYQRFKTNSIFIGNIILKLKHLLGYDETTVQSGASDLQHVQFFSIKQLKNLAKKHYFYISKISPSNFISDVFPCSLVTKKIKSLQQFDCFITKILPLQWSSGFYMLWKNEDSKP